MLSLSISRDFIIVTGNLEITSLRKHTAIIAKVNIFDEKEYEFGGRHYLL